VLDVESSLVEKESEPQGDRSEFIVEFHNVGLTYKNAGAEALTNINLY